MKTKILLSAFLFISLQLSAQQNKTSDTSLTRAAKDILRAINKGDSLLAHTYFLSDTVLDSMFAEIGKAKSDSEKTAMRKFITKKRERLVASVMEYNKFLQKDSTKKTSFIFLNCSAAIADSAGTVTSNRVTINTMLGDKPMELTLTGLHTKKGWYFMDKIKMKGAL